MASLHHTSLLSLADPSNTLSSEHPQPETHGAPQHGAPPANPTQGPYPDLGFAPSQGVTFTATEDAPRSTGPRNPDPSQQDPLGGYAQPPVDQPFSGYQSIPGKGSILVCSNHDLVSKIRNPS